MIYFISIFLSYFPYLSSAGTNPGSPFLACQFPRGDVLSLSFYIYPTLISSFFFLSQSQTIKNPANSLSSAMCEKQITVPNNTLLYCSEGYVLIPIIMDNSIYDYDDSILITSLVAVAKTLANLSLPQCPQCQQ